MQTTASFQAAEATPVCVLASLSRLTNAGTGEGFTHPDHPGLANQLFSAYARATRVRSLASVMGEDSLPDVHTVESAARLQTAYHGSNLARRCLAGRISDRG
jgi:vacuolar-type H+-ATPase subunit B/Vma2